MVYISTFQPCLLLVLLIDYFQDGSESVSKQIEYVWKKIFDEEEAGSDFNKEYVFIIINDYSLI